jgi:hypothetical protein
MGASQMRVHAARTKLGWLLGLSTVAYLAAATARADLVITPNAQDTPTLRSIIANATSVPNASMNARIETKTGGGFNESQTANENNDTGGAAVSVNASQSSSIPNLTGPSMSGMGTVMVTWNPGGNQNAVEDSLFDVFFTVDKDATYILSGRLTNIAPDLAAITTLSATLEDTTNSNTLANHTTAGPFSDTVMLTTDNTYELKLDANFDAIFRE